ncbi:hypothetical protein Tco_1477495, partial [Tanacetum coccineum]
LTIEEKSKLFQQLLEKRKKFFAAKRAKEKRNKPPTKAQQRSIISKRDETIGQESSSKRVGDELEQEKAKKQKIDNDQEEARDEKAYKVKAKHGSTRPEEGYERSLWADLKTMFEPHVEDEVWKMQQVYKVVSWKLFDACEVHYLTLQSGMIYMLVEKRYPLTTATITDMLNKKLQDDHWNEMCYQLLKLITKQLKNQ